MISAELRDFLIEHLDGPVIANGRWFTQRRAALSRGLVKMEPYCAGQPRCTNMTDTGRQELAKALAEWADALAAAQEKGL